MIQKNLNDSSQSYHYKFVYYIKASIKNWISEIYSRASFGGIRTSSSKWQTRSGWLVALRATIVSPLCCHFDARNAEKSLLFQFHNDMSGLNFKF